MDFALVATTPVQLAIDGGQAGSGCLRGGDLTHCYAFADKDEVSALDDVATSMVSDCDIVSCIVRVARELSV